MSNTGNRSNPNQTRVSGHADEAPASGGPAQGEAHPEGKLHQESRDHNKHNNPGQEGHKPQKHTPAQEKH